MDKRKRNESWVEQVGEAMRKFLLDDQQLPLRVCVMGQAGVGKSTLLNALFGTTFTTDPVRTGTKFPETKVKKGKNNHLVAFTDLPGIGDLAQKEQVLKAQYLDELQKADIALWAVHANTRAFVYDQITLDLIIDHLSVEEKTFLISKIAFVLTKADLLIEPEKKAKWFLVKDVSSSAENCFFWPDPRLMPIIKQIEQYFQDKFIAPYAPFIKGKARYKGPLRIAIPGMTYVNGIVSYDGFVDGSLYNKWCNLHPQYQELFNKLYQSCRIIACSAHFKYNLNTLTSVLINKLDTKAANRLKGFVDDSYLERLSLERALRYINAEQIELEELQNILRQEGENE